MNPIIVLTIILFVAINNAAYLGNVIINPSSNQTLYNETYSLLKNVSASNMSKCLKCKTILAVGKELALTNVNLIPSLFTQLCLDEGGSQSTCYTAFHRSTVEHTYQGSDFANLLTLMDPMGLDGEYYCHFQRNGACGYPTTPDFDMSGWWPEKKPEYNIAPEGSGNTFNVLHISDFHMQNDFKVGGEANCTNNLMCCTSHSYNSELPPPGYNFSTSLYAPEELSNISFYNAYYADNGSYVKGEYIDFVTKGNSSIWEPATPFGDFYCDGPEVLINNSLKHMMSVQSQQNLDFEFAIFTGDLVDHDETKYISYNTTVDIETRIFRDIKHYLGGIPVYSVLGNHDTFPYAQLAQKSSQFNNLFEWNAELMSDLWREYDWIDASTAGYASTHYTGFSVVTKRGLKVIALNSNTWYSKNYYTYWGTEQPDTFGQFAFLVNELVKSERVGQRVWIIAHIPAANIQALPAPTKIFGSIVERFSPYTIAGVFYGHTHTDQFQILYSGNGSESSKVLENAVNVGWVSQSITPFIERNPSWRYYEVDDVTFNVVNSINFYTKLNDTYSNGGDEPIWEFEYSAREAYDPNGEFPPDYPLNATFWHSVAQKIKNDEYFNQLYSDYQLRNTPYVPICNGTDECVDNYCYATSFTVDQYHVCYRPDLPSFNF